MIAAGRLRHRVQLQRQVYAQSPATGAETVSWELLADRVRAEVAPLSARELVAAKAVDGEVTLRVTIRYRDDVTDKCRVLFRGKILNIHGVLPDPVSGLEYLTLPCSEGVNDG